MKIQIDNARCCGHQNCVRSAPELFRLKEDGRPEVLNGGLVPQRLEEDAELVIYNCPESAIETVDG